MATETPQRGGLLAEYIVHEYKDDGIKAKPRPVGKRNWFWPLRGLRFLWRRWGYLSGAEPRFAIRVLATNKALEDKWVALQWQFHGPTTSSRENFIAHGIDEIRVGEEFIYKSPHVSGSPGQHRFDATLLLDGIQLKPRRTWVNFNIVASEFFLLWAVTVIVAFLALSFSIIGLLKDVLDDGPTPVVIVEPMPASQSGPDSNER